MATVSVQEAKAYLSRLIERGRSGERTNIAKAGEPVSQLTSVGRPDVVLGGWTGTFDFEDESFEAADVEVAAMWDVRVSATRSG